MPKHKSNGFDIPAAVRHGKRGLRRGMLSNNAEPPAKWRAMRAFGLTTFSSGAALAGLL